MHIENHRELSDTSTIITDVDVLGVAINDNATHQRTIFDCKTQNKMSPINRAFWAKGLMDYIGCSESFVILKKRAPEAHRLSAKTIDVHLFDEKQFSNFAESSSLEFATDFSYSAHIDNWINLQKIYQDNLVFEKFGKFLDDSIPVENDSAAGLRKLLAGLQKGKGEFDPSRVKHNAIFRHALVAMSFLMSSIVNDLKTVIDYDSSKTSFEQILTYYVWGGRDAYLQKKKMSALFSSQNGEPKSSELGHLS